MDSAMIQTLAAGLIVLGAAAFLGRRAIRSVVAARRARLSGSAAACAGGACGCGDGGSTVSEERAFVESSSRLTSRR
jgi:hypothetical protein